MKKVRALALKKETVRHLSGRQVAQVRGGIITDTDPTSGGGGTVMCPSYQFECDTWTPITMPP